MDEALGRDQHLAVERRFLGTDLTNPVNARGPCVFDESGSFMAESLRGWSALLARQRFEAGNDVEQFLVDASLAQTMECPGEVLQQFVDIFVSALHRRQAALIL